MTSTISLPDMPAPSSEARFWDRIARKYAADPIKDMAGYERTLERTTELLSPADTVLEIGCGTGTTALRLAGHVRRLHATDLSGEMITIARDKADAAGVRNVTFDVGSANSIGDGAYDAVLAFNLLHLLHNRSAALRQAHAALKPGGLFISKTPCISEMNALIQLAVPLMRLIGKAPHVAYFTGHELEEDLEQAGFMVIERGRHGTRGKDPRAFIVARRPR